jgi:hypothetical protein
MANYRLLRLHEMVNCRKWTIGADPTCEIVVDQPTVSGRHCQFISSPEGLFIEDLNSTNGTWVNGVRITGACPVTGADRILLGSKVRCPWPMSLSDGNSAASAIQSAVSQNPRSAIRFPGDHRVTWTLLIAGMMLASFTLVASMILKGSAVHSERPNSIAADNSSAAGESLLLSAGADATARETASAVRLSDSHHGIESTALSSIDFASEQRNVVWVGYRLRDYAFTYASGWLARSDSVITTATVIADLELLAKQDIEPVVWLGGQIRRVAHMHVHPEFDHSNPESPISRYSNVGLLKLEDAFESHCTVASVDELDGLSGQQQLFVIGYESSLGENEPFDEIKVKRLQNAVTIVSSEVLASNSARLYRLRAPTARSFEGAAIFNVQKHVIGVLSSSEGEVCMVPVSQLSPLLESDSR